MRQEVRAALDMNIAEYHEMLRLRPCIVSGLYPVALHHVIGASIAERLGRGRGGRKSSDWLVLPLHYDYHQGTHGLHTIGIGTWEALHGTEAELLDRLIGSTGFDAWASAQGEYVAKRALRKYKKPSKINARRV